MLKRVIGDHSDVLILSDEDKIAPELTQLMAKPEWMNLAEVAGNFDSLGGRRWSLVCLLCLLYTSPSPRDATLSRMPSSA